LFDIVDQMQFDRLRGSFRSFGLESYISGAAAVNSEVSWVVHT